jgi:hypothetical protein
MSQRKHERLPTDPIFEAGDRVRIQGDPFGFEDGTMGTIASSTPHIFVRDDGRRLFSYLVKFDEPQDDGSGDGPYSAASILADHIQLVKWAL